jgi:hypothetical protein
VQAFRHHFIKSALINFLQRYEGRVPMSATGFDFKSIQLEQLANKLGEVFKQSPARDLEQNIKAGISGWLTKLDLVSREEFDVQAEVLARTREKLTQLEARLAELEARHQTAKD